MWVFSDSFQVVCGCFAFRCGMATTCDAQMLAVMHAIEKARDLGWSQVWLENDLQNVVQLLQKRSNKVSQKFYNWWMICLAFIFQIHLKASHVFR